MQNLEKSGHPRDEKYINFLDIKKREIDAGELLALFDIN